MLGLLVAPVVPPLLFAVAVRSGEGIGVLIFFGFMSVFILYLPLILWRLPRTRHPFQTCLLAGIVASPGPFGYVLMVIAISGGAWAGLLIFAFTGPLGAVGGFVFWMCAFWRGDNEAIFGRSAEDAEPA